MLQISICAFFRLVSIAPHGHDPFLRQLQIGRDLQQISNDVLELALGGKNGQDLNEFFATLKKEIKRMHHMIYEYIALYRRNMTI